MWEAISWVSGVFTLLAFIAAVIAWIWRRQLTVELESIRLAPQSKRARLILAKRGVLFDIDSKKLNDLTSEQILDLANSQIQSAEARFRARAKLIAIVAAIAGIVTTIAIICGSKQQITTSDLRRSLEQREEGLARITEATKKLEDQVRELRDRSREQENSTNRLVGGCDATIRMVELTGDTVAGIKNLKFLVKEFNEHYPFGRTWF